MINTNNEKCYRSASWEAEQGEKISGYALVFNQRTVLFKDPETGLEYGEQIDRHALDSANMSDVVLKYNHTGRVLARTRNNSLVLSVDDHGLKIVADMSGSDEALSILKDIRSGLLDKMSFAFTTAPNGATWDAATRTRTVTHIDRVFDVSVVDLPAYEQTEVSARSLFTPFAEQERRVRQINTIRSELQAIADNFGLIDENYTCHTGWGRPDDDEKAITAKGQELAKRFIDWKKLLKTVPDDLSGAQTFAAEWRNSVTQFRQMQYDREQRRKAIAARIASGLEGTPLPNPCAEFERRSFNNPSYDYGRAKNMKNIETRAFYSDLLEKRSAGTTGTMSAMIPDTIIDNYIIETAPGAFLMDSQSTAIAHSGDLSIPIATLQDVSEHEENAEIEANGYTPGMLTIHHKEYAYNVGYSRSGVMLSVDSFMSIVSSTLMGSMLKKMDGICYDAVAGLTYDTNNSVTVSGSAPAFDDFVAAAGKLGTDYINRAKWYMNSTTYFNWVLGLKDSSKKPVFDPSKKIEEQALLGYPLAIDSQIPADTLYFGDGSRIHLNYADPVQIVLWTDHDHNTEKAGVNTVAGAAVEPGSFVKLSR